MWKKIKAFFGIKPKMETYVRVSDIAHYGGKTPDWAVRDKKDEVGQIVHAGKGNLVRTFVITEKHKKGR